jgi:hypothetical protein
MTRDWTAEFEANEREWLNAARKARARRRQAGALALAALLTVAAFLACRHVTVLRAIVEGQASRNPRHWWRMRRGEP